MKKRLAVMGASGRMGTAIVRSALEDSFWELTAAVVRDGSPKLGRDVGETLGLGSCGVAFGSDLVAAVEAGDVLVDFSTADAAAGVVSACAQGKTPLVIGTTGLSREIEAQLAELGAKVPLVEAANTSVGVAVLSHLAQQAVELLGHDFDVELVEMHHRNKVDAPSGTAVMISERLARARGLEPNKAILHGRSGATGPRSQDEIGVMTLRGGDVIGEHTIYLAGPGERLELTHRAQDRSLFAKGALRAAKWLVASHVPAGRYGMADVLGLTQST